MDRKTHITVHMPRKSEAVLSPDISEDITVWPRFYRRTGWVPVFYFTVIDVAGNEDRHVMSINATNKQIRVERLVEVTPACDDPRRKENKDVTGTAATNNDDEAAED